MVAVPQGQSTNTHLPSPPAATQETQRGATIPSRHTRGCSTGVFSRDRSPTPVFCYLHYFLLAHVNPHNSHAAKHPQNERKMSFSECWVKRTGMEMVGEDEEGRAAAGRAHSHVLPISNKPFKPLKFFQYCQFYYKNSLRQNKKPVANPNIFKNLICNP